MRCAIVASATCRVVRPATARSVSATAEGGVSAGCAHRKKTRSVSSAVSAGPRSGSSSTATSRRCRAVSDRTTSRKRRQATVTSQPLRSRGGSARSAAPGAPKVRHASTSASCTASSAVAKSAPRRTRTPMTAGTSGRSVAVSKAPSRAPGAGGASAAVTGSGVGRGRCAVEGAHLEPLVDRPAVLARGQRQLAGELDGTVPAVDVDDVPPGDEVLGLRERAVGGRLALLVGPHPGALGREGLRVDVLAVLLQPLAEVVHELHVRVDLLGRPLVHRDVVHGGGRAAVVLEDQVLRHVGAPCQVRPIVAASTPGTKPCGASRHPRHTLFSPVSGALEGPPTAPAQVRRARSGP